MKEQLINFETSKLAKEKGFDQVMLGLSILSNPTQFLLQKWLREIHNIDIEIQIMTFGINNEKIGYSFSIIKNGNAVCRYFHFKTYEDSLEMALQEGLKLI